MSAQFQSRVDCAEVICIYLHGDNPKQAEIAACVAKLGDWLKLSYGECISIEMELIKKLELRRREQIMKGQLPIIECEIEQSKPGNDASQSKL